MSQIYLPYITGGEYTNPPIPEPGEYKVVVYIHSLTEQDGELLLGYPFPQALTTPLSREEANRAAAVASEALLANGFEPLAFTKDGMGVKSLLEPQQVAGIDGSPEPDGIIESTDFDLEPPGAGEEA